MKRTDDSVIQEVSCASPRIKCSAILVTLQDEMETVLRKSSYKDELKRAESLENSGPDGLTK